MGKSGKMGKAGVFMTAMLVKELMLLAAGMFGMFALPEKRQ